MNPYPETVTGDFGEGTPDSRHRAWNEGYIQCEHDRVLEMYEELNRECALEEARQEGRQQVVEYLRQREVLLLPVEVLLLPVAVSEEGDFQGEWDSQLTIWGIPCLYPEQRVTIWQA